MSHADGGMEEIEQDILRNMLRALFGPTMEYIGRAVEEMPERRRANIVRICKIALARLGTDIAEPGRIAPRVARCLIEEGSYVEGLVSSHYWGGVLACSRTTNELDDRGARKMMALARMGEYDIRTHYLYYATLRLLLRHFREPDSIDFSDTKARFRLATFVPSGYYILAMNFNKNEIENHPTISSDILMTLGMEFLVDGSNAGPDHYLKEFFNSRRIRGEGVIFTPGPMGIRLFQWAFGYRDKPYSFFLARELDCLIDGIQMGVDESALVYDD